MNESIHQRWPPTYDFDDLKDQIKDLVNDGSSPADFYREDPNLPEVCQGDVIRLGSNIPMIDEDGEPSAMDRDTDYWLVVGNTCDYERSEVSHLGVCPIFDYEPILGGRTESLRRYETSRIFHVQPWVETLPTSFGVDLTLTVGASKKALTLSSERCCRMSMKGWFLFHCCLVRFFARDDGRHD